MGKGLTVALAVGGAVAAAAALFYVISHREKTQTAATGNPQVTAAAAPPAPTTTGPTGVGLVNWGLGLASQLITTYGGRAVAGSGQLAELGLARYNGKIVQENTKAI